MNKPSGFTAIELMVTVAVISILAALVVPSFNALISNNRLVSRSNDFVAALGFARMEAIKQGRAITLCNSADGNSCKSDGLWETGWIIFPDADGDGNLTVPDPDDDLKDCEDPSSECLLRSHGSFGTSSNTMRGTDSAATGQIRFSGQGLLDSGPTDFTVCDTRRGEGRLISISLTGLPTISRDKVTCS